MKYGLHCTAWSMFKIKQSVVKIFSICIHEWTFLIYSDMPDLPDAEHITPVLKSLHWLPVHQGIDFKNRPLSFIWDSLLSVPRIKSKQGEAAFSFCAPHLWNKLPEYLRSAKTVRSFKSRIKILFAVDFQ